MSTLPAQFDAWFARRGWSAHPHQLDMLDRAQDPATLLIAPTGGGKTLAGFLPSLVELTGGHQGLHTLYVSPLKALAADIRRNLRRPVEEVGLDIRIEERTGDTPALQKKRQRADPPHILLTTPESLALLTSYEDAAVTFAGLQRVIVDEIHALAESKRGDQLMLALARLQTLRPELRRVGLSATVEDPGRIAGLLARHPDPCHILHADPGPDPDIRMLQTEDPPPWSGGGAKYAIPAVLEEVKKHRTTLIFHNTRAQAEIFFHNLWLANDDALPIAIHHGSLAREQRHKVEAAMLAGKLRAIVCTGTLDLGIDWGDVDLIIQVGAPKNVKRLIQRIGRANHRYNAPSKAILVPANRFEVVECVAALEAARAHELDGDPAGRGPRDVLCQQILIAAAGGGFRADDLYGEIRSVGAYADLSRAEFDACLDFAATGGYALRAYDRWQRLVEDEEGVWRLRDPRAAQRIRQNIGTIMDSELVKVRMRGHRKPLGEIEEDFAATLTPGDTFLIAGRVVQYRRILEQVVEVTKTNKRKPKVAVFGGTKFATSTQLSQRILRLMHQPIWPELPQHTADWLMLQREVSQMPTADRILVESFPHDGRAHTCVYGFAGRNAMQTLGLLLTQRMDQEALMPMGFVSTDYAVLIWGLEQVADPAPLFQRDALRAGFETWLSGNMVMKKTFKVSAVVSGLVDRKAAGLRKTGRQTAFSTNILYDTLRKYDPDHVLMQITREEAMKGLVDFGRIEEMLARTQGRVDHVIHDRVTPLAAPLLLEAGRVTVDSAAVTEKLLAEEAEKLMQEAGL
ncbi:ATP-dependent helicase, DEAD/DEAH box family [Candidatus Rhodobacter oscarellae]|uniref:ATP-dependent helicase, DEAD/DEAH box family n=1 Tax=Candidatus Rhodobacter oscarellae TaxID=1675527 RepID=A0A0J9E9L5_9RHOB|nr:ligase-associated DNA damage response DEXH box helicase [Candidatus Rhodobacter lobularis]KMW59487.1 ATP-dependent helicase, DEAD/DEAH box family [Candidatus Rhodobacter lobularis]